MRHTLPIVFAVLLFTGCPADSRTCVADDECFAGEVCRADGVCGDPIPDTGEDTSSSTSDAGTDFADGGPMGDDSGSEDTGSSDASDPDPDVSVSPDADQGTDAADTALGPCGADPFEPCMDEEDADNNAFPGELVTNMTRGCVNDEFKTMDMTIDGRMCPLDPMDMYEFLVVECFPEDGGFVVEAILDVTDDCDPDDIAFEVGGIGESCADPGGRVQCETLPDGRRRIRVLYPGTDNAVVGSIRFWVETPARDDIEFDYTLQLVVRR